MRADQNMHTDLGSLQKACVISFVWFAQNFGKKEFRLGPTSLVIRENERFIVAATWLANPYFGGEMVLSLLSNGYK